jgi:hypothetical protein
MKSHGVLGTGNLCGLTVGEYPVEPGFPGKRSANTVARYAHGGTPIELRSPKG